MALPEMSGTSKAGNAWKKREYVLETQETYPKKVHFDFFGERADQYLLNVGDEITLSFDIESREYQGRWYTSIRGWKAEKQGAAQQPADVPPVGIPDLPPIPSVPDPLSGGGAAIDDLPF